MTRAMVLCALPLALAACASTAAPADWNDRPLIDYDPQAIFGPPPCSQQVVEPLPDGSIAIVDKACPPRSEAPRRRRERA